MSKHWDTHTLYAWFSLCWCLICVYTNSELPGKFLQHLLLSLVLLQDADGLPPLCSQLPLVQVIAQLFAVFHFLHSTQAQTQLNAHWWNRGVSNHVGLKSSNFNKQRLIFFIHVKFTLIFPSAAWARTFSFSSFRLSSSLVSRSSWASKPFSRVMDARLFFSCDCSLCSCSSLSFSFFSNARTCSWQRLSRSWYTWVSLEWRNISWANWLSVSLWCCRRAWTCIRIRIRRIYSAFVMSTGWN